MNTRSSQSLTAPVIEREMEVLNRLGLHAQPATDFVRCAKCFGSEIELRVRGQIYSAKRVIDLLLANLNQGTRFTIVARGADAEFAVEALSVFLKRLGELDHEEANGLKATRLHRFDLEDF